MSSRSCESCLGSGEKPSLGHMQPYKCLKCSGTGKIHNFNDVVRPDVKETPIAAPEESRILIPTVIEEPKRRGRPPKN